MVKRLLDKIKENIHYSFITKSVIIISIIILIDFTAGSILNKLYFMQNHGFDYRTTFTMEQNTADLLVFGASSANHHYRPDAFGKTNLSFYNCGRDGNFIFYHYAILQATLKRYKPKLVILDITEEDFYKSPDSYDRISSLLPYYKTHPEIKEIVEMKSKWEQFKMLSRIYPFNSKIISSFTGYIDMYDKRFEEEKNSWLCPPVQ